MAKSFMQLSDKEREAEITITVAELHQILYSLDWIQIMKDAVESRPNSWGVQKGEEYTAVPQWRNASDTLTQPVWKHLYRELQEEVKHE